MVVTSVISAALHREQRACRGALTRHCLLHVFPVLLYFLIFQCSPSALVAGPSAIYCSVLSMNDDRRRAQMSCGSHPLAFRRARHGYLLWGAELPSPVVRGAAVVLFTSFSDGLGYP
jgi:hypothetical protein